MNEKRRTISESSRLWGSSLCLSWSKGLWVSEGSQGGSKWRWEILVQFWLTVPHSKYEAVSDQGPVWVQREAIFQGSFKAFLNGQICSNYYNMMYWERILQKNHLITCFRRFYQRPYHLAAQMPMLGWVDVGKLIKVANIHSGFYVCYTN